MTTDLLTQRRATQSFPLFLWSKLGTPRCKSPMRTQEILLGPRDGTVSRGRGRAGGETAGSPPRWVAVGGKLAPVVEGDTAAALMDGDLQA